MGTCMHLSIRQPRETTMHLSIRQPRETTMNRSIILRPLAGIVALAVGVGPALASVPPAARPARVTPHLAARPAHVTPQTRSIPAGLRGTLVALHRAQRIGDLAVANGSLFPLRFTSVALEQRLRVGSLLTVSGDARHHVRLLVRTVRTNGVSARAHIRGLVAR